MIKQNIKSSCIIIHFKLSSHRLFNSPKNSTAQNYVVDWVSIIFTHVIRSRLGAANHPNCYWSEDFGLTSVNRRLCWVVGVVTALLIYLLLHVASTVVTTAILLRHWLAASSLRLRIWVLRLLLLLLNLIATMILWPTIATHILSSISTRSTGRMIVLIVSHRCMSTIPTTTMHGMLLLIWILWHKKATLCICVVVHTFVFYFAFC